MIALPTYPTRVPVKNLENIQIFHQTWLDILELTGIFIWRRGFTIPIPSQSGISPIRPIEDGLEMIISLK